MTSGNRFPALLALLLALGALPARAADLTLDQLMALRQAIKSESATFTEKRTLSILDQPIESEGTLLFVAPDHLEKHTRAPHEEHLVVEGDAIRIEQAEEGKRNHTRRFSLEDSEEMSALIGSVRGTLAGDEAALLRYYEVALSGPAEDWALQLIPKDEKTKKLVDFIRIAGAQDKIHTIEIVEQGGDRSVMTITKTGS